MTRPQLEVAEIIRSCRDEFLQRYGVSLTPEQRRALDDLMACRTAALGGHVLECPECGHQEISYNSCGNRHCPKCQATAAARWLETQAADLLDTPYYAQAVTMVSSLSRTLENIEKSGRRTAHSFWHVLGRSDGPAPPGDPLLNLLTVDIGYFSLALSQARRFMSRLSFREGQQPRQSPRRIILRDYVQRSRGNH